LINHSRFSPDCADCYSAGRENATPAAHLLTAADQRSSRCPLPFSKAASVMSVMPVPYLVDVSDMIVARGSGASRRPPRRKHAL
jgi:hypothetical protein